jgi:hypothetical protein
VHRTWIGTAAAVLALLGTGCGAVRAAVDPQAARPDVATIAAVDHVGEVLAAAGHGAPAIPGLVMYRCGPADELFGVAAIAEPVTVLVPWSDVAPEAESVGQVLPPPQPDPTAGAPAHVDRVEVAGDGWTVRWGVSNVIEAADGEPATVVTVVGGGEVAGADVTRWREAGLLEVWPCG